MKIIKSLVIVFLFLLLAAKTSLAWSDWLCLKTEHFKVFYKPWQEPEARRVLETLEYYRPKIEKLCGNEVKDFSVVINDAGALANGFTNPVNKAAHLFRHSPGVWGGVENWWSFVGPHEYIHELSMSKTDGVPGILTDIFGNLLFFMPNTLVPGWICEGITVYGESQLTKYQGRLNDGFFDAYIGARAAANRLPSILEATYQPLEYPLGEGSYNYGGAFFNYLANTYDEAKFAEFFAENGSSLGSLVPFLPGVGLDRSAKRVFGKAFPDLWEEWRNYEMERFKKFRMEGRQVTKTGWGMKFPRFWNGKLYYQRDYYRKTGAFESSRFCDLMELDPVTGKERKIVANFGFGTPFKIRNGKLYYTMQVIKTGFDNASLRSYGIYTWLQEFDLVEKKGKTVLKDEIRAFEVSKDGKLIYTKDRRDGFGSEIYLREPKAKDSKLLFQTDYLIEELESKSGRTVVVARKDWETWSIFMLNMETGEFTPLINTPYMEFGISIEGDKLFFSANYEKNLSSFCYDFVTTKFYRLTENGLAIYPTYDQSNNQLYYVGINANGYDIYCQPVNFKEFQLPESPATIAPVFDLADVAISREGYRENLKTLAPCFWIPLINSDDQKVGVHFEGGDAVMDFPWYTGEIGFNYDKEEYFGALNLEVNYLAPFHMELSFEKDDETTAKLTMDYPLFSAIEIGASFGVDPDYDGYETAPFIELGSFLKVSTPKSKLKNGELREALYAQMKLSDYLLGGKLKILAKYIDDPQNPDSVFEEIRGYDEALKAGKGQVYSFEYSHPLWKIRKGFWNPNIFFEDLTFMLFNDRAISESGLKQESQGLELHLETRTAYMFALDWGCRYVRNDGGDTKVEIFVKNIISKKSI